MSARMLPLLFSLALVRLQDVSAPRLVTEDLEGRRGLLALEELPLADPRKKGIWLVRPEGFDAPKTSEANAAPAVRLELANRDVLTGRIRGGSGEVLEVELPGGVVVPFALEDLRSLVVPARAAGASLEPAREGDRLYRLSGALEPIDGALEAFTSEGVRFDSELGLRTTPWDEVGALFLENLEGGGAARPVDVPVLLSFTGPAGGRVRGGLLRLERASCRISLAGKTEVALPLGAVAELLVDDGRLSYLSDLVPAEESGRGAPFGDELGMSWPHRLDQSVLGTELRAGGRTHARGIGVHAPSRLTFLLDPPARGLRGSVAIDDSSRLNPASARGSVVFRVLVDGRVLWESPLVRGGDPPLVLPALALEGTRELVLEADPAGDFAGDRADWLGLMLVR